MRLSAPSIRPDALHWILASLVLTVAPHAVRLPWWVTLFAILLAVASLAATHRGAPLPGIALRSILVAVGVTGIYANFGTVLGRDAGVALLITMLGLKLLEIHGQRDIFVLIFLGYFLIVTQFLYSQSILSAAYMLLGLGLLTAALITLNDPNRALRPQLRLGLAVRLLLQSVPLALLLFLLFPRVNGPLWGLPNDAYSGLTGLSDEVAPGRISRLSQSDAVAFRASFAGPIPPNSQRYWRGPVFWYTDGQRWTGTARPTRAAPAHGIGSPLCYTVTLEPHQKHWLFTLGLPATIPDIAQLTPDLQLLARKPVKALIQYDLASYPDFRTDSLTAAERTAGLQLPSGWSPRARALGREWRAQLGTQMGTGLGTDQHIVQRALAYFREQSFFYTLEPPPTPTDPVDEFLFDTRRGYCEHYAAAFTVLMRAAGVPARLVTGYQGGSLNPLGNYLIVRQMDAHAWVEVWLQGRGWTQVDPTAAVAPDRIEWGMQELRFSPAGPLIHIGLARGDFLRWGLRQLRFGWDALNQAWNQWVLAYGPQLQLALLSRLGWPQATWREMTMALLFGLGLALTLLARYLLHPAATPDPVLRSYRRFCQKLARQGLSRPPSEPPLAYAARAAAALPQHATEITQITALYTQLRYGAHADPQALGELRAAVRRFRP